MGDRVGLGKVFFLLGWYILILSVIYMVVDLGVMAIQSVVRNSDGVGFLIIILIGTVLGIIGLLIMWIRGEKIN